MPYANICEIRARHFSEPLQDFVFITSYALLETETSAGFKHRSFAGFEHRSFAGFEHGGFAGFEHRSFAGFKQGSKLYTSGLPLKDRFNVRQYFHGTTFDPLNPLGHYSDQGHITIKTFI